MKQTSLSEQTGFQRYSKKTKRAAFSEEMEQVVPWSALCALLEPHYPKAGNGCCPVGVERMLRIYFLQQWFSLSDPTGVRSSRPPHWAYRSPPYRRDHAEDERPRTCQAPRGWSRCGHHIYVWLRRRDNEKHGLAECGAALIEKPFSFSVLEKECESFSVVIAALERVSKTPRVQTCPTPGMRV